jgi:hypothetical protein
MYCHAVIVHTDEIIHLYFLVYQFTWTHEEDWQVPQMVLVELIIFKYVCSRFFMLCLWCDQSEFMGVVWFLICGLVQVLFTSHVFNF